MVSPRMILPYPQICTTLYVSPRAPNNGSLSMEDWISSDVDAIEGIEDVTSNYMHGIYIKIVNRLSYRGLMTVPDVLMASP
jgi:hypothetical protein